MKAIAVEPKKPGTVRYEDIPEPDMRDGSILVEAISDHQGSSMIGHPSSFRERGDSSGKLGIEEIFGWIN